MRVPKYGTTRTPYRSKRRKVDGSKYPPVSLEVKRHKYGWDVWLISSKGQKGFPISVPGSITTRRGALAHAKRQLSRAK